MKKQSWLTLALLSFITPACDFDEFSVNEENLAFGNDCPNLNKINGYDCTEKSCLIGEEKYDYSRNFKYKKCPKAYPTCVDKQCIKKSDMESCPYEDGSITPHGSFRCFSEGTGIIKLCNDGKWDNIDECEGGCNAKQTDCSDKLNPCIGDDNKTYADTIYHCFTEGETSTVRTCSNGEWKDDEICIDLSCNAQNVACGQCFNGKTKHENIMVMDDDGNAKEICHSLTCINGTWAVAPNSSCPEASSCLFDEGGKADCGTCINGTSRCQEYNNIGIIEVCENGEYKKAFDCLSDSKKPLSCNSDNSGCGECLTNNYNYLNINNTCNKIICQNGSWSNTDGDYNIYSDYHCLGPCNNVIDDEYCSCKDGESDCSCEEGSTICSNKTSGGVRLKCQTGKWEEFEKCNDSNSCHSNGTDCGVCKNGNTRCIDDEKSGHIETCQNGVWIKTSDCANLSSCHSEKECGKCQNNAKKYEDLPDKTCQQYICQSGEWLTDKPCLNQTSCLKDSNNDLPTACGDCINYTFKNGETGNDFYMCLNGKYEQHNCINILIRHKVEEIGSFLVCDQGINITHNYDNLECINKIENGVNIGYQLTQKNKIDKNCGDDVSCTITGVGASECGVCQDGKTRCRTPQMQQTCLNGQWGFDQTCNCTGEGVCELEQE